MENHTPGSSNALAIAEPFVQWRRMRYYPFDAEHRDSERRAGPPSRPWQRADGGRSPRERRYLHS